MTRVKVCGITNLEDAWVATEAGADALGFVFVPNTPRYIEPDHANTIMRQIPPLVTTIGLFVDVDGAHTPQKGRIGSDMGEFVFISETLEDGVASADDGLDDIQDKLAQQQRHEGGRG